MNPGIECKATRRGRSWVAYIPEHGLYGHGRTLKAVRDNLAEGLAFLGVSTPVTLIPVTPELQLLRAAEQARDAALQEAVAALAMRRATMSDIAEATGARTGRIKALLAQRTTDPTEPDRSEPGDHDTDLVQSPVEEAVDPDRPESIGTDFETAR